MAKKPIYESIAQWCQRTGASRASAYRRIHDGTIKAKKLGNRTLLVVDDEASLKDYPVKGDAA